MKSHSPSIKAIMDYRAGKAGMEKIVKTFALRSAMLWLGFYLFSDREHAVRNGLVGSTVIEVYLLWYFSSDRVKRIAARECVCPTPRPSAIPVIPSPA
jgi:hypothetical protein